MSPTGGSSFTPENCGEELLTCISDIPNYKINNRDKIIKLFI